MSVINEITKGINRSVIENNFSSFFKNDKDEFRDSLSDHNKVLMDCGMFMSTWGSNVTKIKRINMVCEKLGVQNVVCEIIV